MEPRHRRIIEPGDRFPSPDERLAAGEITARQHAELAELGLAFAQLPERERRSGAALTLAQARRDPRFRAAVGLRVRDCSTRNRGPVRRESHRGRPGHRRGTRSTRAGPSDDDGSEPPPPVAPRLKLAPKPKALLTFACLTAEQRGEA